MAGQLILIEGLPGTGKSTLSQWLAGQYAMNRIPANWHYEISSANPLKFDRQPVAEVPTEALFAHGLQTWRHCAKHVQEGSSTVILDAGLFQHITMEAFRRGCSPPAIKGYISQVEATIAPLQPLVIYFSPDDIKQHIEKTYKMRGERFTKLIVDWCGDSFDAKQKGYMGHQGSIRFWSDFAAICRDCLSMMRAATLQLDVEVAKPNWPEQQNAVLEQLGLQPVDISAELDPKQFAGTYFDATGHRGFSIAWNGISLLAKGLLEPLEQESVLIALGNNRLVVRGHDTELEFSDHTVLVHSSWPRINGNTFRVAR